MSVRRKERSKFPFIAGLFLVVSAQSFAGASSFSQQQTGQLEGTGSIAGKVRLEGRFKKPAPLKVYKNRDFCGAEVPNESLIVGPQGSLKNAVVIIHGSREQKTAPPLKDLFLDNKNCAFVPHVQIVPVGSEIALLNSDPILHDVHARLGSETLFNVGLPTWRQVKKQLNRTGIIRIECEVLHTWMSAYIVVTASSYFAVTDEKGEFVLEGVPIGNYEIEVWHEKLGRQLRRIMVTEGSTLRVDFIYPSGK